MNGVTVGGGMRWWWMVVLAGSNPYRAPLLAGTFKEVCPSGDPVDAWVRFHKGGSFEYSYPAPDDWGGDADETWRLRKAELTVSWNGGYAVSVYDLGRRSGEVAPGRSSTPACATTASLVRVGGR